MKAIELSQGIFAIVDDDVHSWLRHWNWSVAKMSKRRYARRQVIHPTTHQATDVYLHRVVAGVNKDFYVRFRDDNPLNIQRENLCITDGRRHEIVWDGSRSESLFKGVLWDKYHGLWKAHLKGLTIGHFVCEFDAALAYNETAEKILKDRADLNNLEAVCRRK